MTGNYINERREEERRDAIDADRSKWLVPFAAGIGVIGLGAMMLKSRLNYGGNFTSNIFSFLGIPKGIGLASDLATNVGKSEARSSTSGIRSILSTSFDFNRNRVNIGPIDIIDDLRNTIELMGTVGDDIASHIKEQTVEFINRAHVNAGNNAGYFTENLQRVTFGQVLKDQDTWRKILGTDQFSVIEKANKMGLVRGSMVMDKRVFFNPNTKEILDLRLRNLVSKVKKFEVGGKEVFERVGRFDLFGQASVFSSLYGVNRNVAVLGPDNTFSGTRFFIGGDVFGYVYNPKTRSHDAVRLGTNKFLRKTGDAFEVFAASRQGRLDIVTPKRTGFFGGIIGFMEQSLGIGPAFANRPSFLHRWLINPYKRYRALQDGSGTIIRHPFRREFAVSKVVDAAMGGELPELAKLGGHVVPIAGGGVKVGLPNVTGASHYILPKRVGVFFDVADEYSVVKTAAYRDYQKGLRTALVGKDLVVPLPGGGYKIRGKKIPDRSFANKLTDIDRGDLTAVGFQSTSNMYRYYDVAAGKSKLLTNLMDFANYAIYRINSLASESFLGIGFAPSHSLTKNIARLATIPIAYEAGLKTAEYADYLSEKFTGISPIKAVASVYAAARVTQQKLREVTGLRAAMDFLDTYFPGSVNSDGSTIIRSILAPVYAANAFLRRGSLGGAVAAAAGTYAAIGGSQPQQTASDLMAEYAGDKKVPVRKGAFWGLGYLPFSGGRVTRYDYSWYAKLMSDYRTKSLYGSKSEYWSYHANVFGIPFPTPSNLFGVLNVLNPYRLESLHYHDRPYAQTESPLINFPIIGPALARTVGQIMKPTVYRQPDRLPLLEAGLAERGMTPGAAQQLGIPVMNATAYEAEDPTTIINTIRRQANIATEPLGVYKFVLEFFGLKFGEDIGTKYATSATMQDPGRFLYDLGVGGALGQTEFIRRFMLSDYSSEYRRSADINPIRNNLPDWLPGAYARNKRDQNYFIDFTQGDPYSKIADGEARLPGAGYEALNELHSGVQGKYSDVDRFLILSDVAPYSDAYKQYQKRVLAMDLSPEWEEKVQDAIKQRQEVIGLDTRYKRYEEDITAMNMNIIARSAYAPLRKAYDFLTHDVLAEIPYLGSKFFPFRSPYEQYRKMYVEGSEFASWDRPWEDILRPMAYDMATEDPLTAAGKGAMLGYLMSGPMRWFTPFKSIVGGAGGQAVNMAAVKWGAGIGAGLSAVRIGSLNSQDMIPSHVQAEAETVQYLDTVNYIRNRTFETLGGGFKYKMAAERSLIGAVNPVGYRSALPTSAHRRYFDYFSSLEDHEMRSQILGGVPSYMQMGLESVWGGGFPTREEADARALETVSSSPLPDPSWYGWNPEVSNSAARLRLIQHGINGVSDNYHRFGFYESHEVDMKTRLSELANQEINFVQSPMYGSFDQFLVNHAKAVAPGRYVIDHRGTPRGSRRQLTVEIDRDKENLQYLRHR